jgi:D-alanine-D-alanine ligase
MSGTKVRVGVLFGGRSAEHEVSIRSAQSILEAFDTDRFEAVPIGIDREGQWFINDSARTLLDTGEQVTLIPSKTDSSMEHHLVARSGAEDLGTIDVVFPVLHGPYGEDGTVQGLLELADIPYVGSGVLGSAVGMDKDVAKRLLRDANIRIAPFASFHALKAALEAYTDIAASLGPTLFVKPANLGSSVGVSKSRSEGEYREAIREAFTYDTKVIVEREIVGREIECSVLGDVEPITSVPGEIKPTDEFYSYEAKYIDENGAELIIPAPLDKTTSANIRKIARDAFVTLCLSGMARVDMFLEDSGGIVVNEVNTIPGFTSISMYPKLWEATGLSFSDLVSRLIDLAIQRHDAKKSLSSRYRGNDD